MRAVQSAEIGQGLINRTPSSTIDAPAAISATTFGQTRENTTFNQVSQTSWGGGPSRGARSTKSLSLLISTTLLILAFSKIFRARVRDGAEN
jgi:hypothetical protein